MTRLVVVSNRLADPRRPAAGGLAVALGESLQRIGGLWFGWNGTVVPEGTPDLAAQLVPRLREAGRVTLAETPLGTSEHDGYYRGYSNGVLWPVFHYRLDLAHVEPGFLDGYRAVNQRFARQLAPLLKPDDLVWVHDYHLLPLAAELRLLGCRQRIGFFLHIPMPPAQILAALPQAHWLPPSLFAYDLIGVQSSTDLTHLEHYLGGNGALRDRTGRWRAGEREFIAGSFPIGIDVSQIEKLLQARASREMYARIKQEYSRRQVVVGVDRLDYSKGLPERVAAFRELMIRYPETRKKATLVQITSPSREDVDAYDDIRRNLESLSGSINGDFGELDWMPIRYIHRTVARNRLPGLYRASRVALITPLRDGMNLVAKEFVASQDPDDPGVLVLSRFTGAAEQMQESLLVNPYDTSETASALKRALEMPIEERRWRHAALLRRVCDRDVHWWCRTLLDTLSACPQSSPSRSPEPAQNRRHADDPVTH